VRAQQQQQTTLSSTEPAFQLTASDLPALIAALSAENDDQRQAARRALHPTYKNQASQLGRPLIEQLAALAHTHWNNYQVGTQLVWALRNIQYDEPAWVSAWIDAATTANSPAKTIVSNFYRPTAAVFQVMLSHFPTAPAVAQTSLLRSLTGVVHQLKLDSLSDMSRLGISAFQRRVARRRKLDSLSEATATLLDWWPLADEDATRETLLDLWGIWPGVDDAILTRLQTILQEEPLPPAQQTAAYRALARQIMTQLGAEIHSTFYYLGSKRAEAAAQPAWVRLYATVFIELTIEKPDISNKIEEELKQLQQLDAIYIGQTIEKPDEFNKIEEEQIEEELKQQRTTVSQSLYNKLTATLSSDEEALFHALWQAGNDDDPWDDNYHGILAQTARLLLADNPHLTSLLLSRYQEALQTGEWEERRILLAFLAACLETMPRLVQKSARENHLDLEKMLIASAQDAGSYISRQYALTCLSYLRRVSGQITPVLIAGLQDNVDVVREDALAACSRFQTVEDTLIDKLGPCLTGDSIQTAYGVARMLATIGVFAAGENSAQRQAIIRQLVAALDHPGSQREYKKSGEKKVKLADTFYEALLQVTGLPA
jgi:hypothetical protein